MPVKITKEDEILLDKFSRSSSKRAALLRANAVAKEVNQGMTKEKKINKKERDDEIRERTREVADYESTTFSIFYSNCIFLTIMLVSSVLLQRFSAHLNYFVSMLLAAGSTAFLSSGKSSL